MSEVNTQERDEEYEVISALDLEDGKRIVKIGRQGENKTQTVRIDCSALAEGLTNPTFAVYARRHGEDTCYQATNVTASDNVVTWTLDSNDTACAGYGEAEIRLIVGESVKKSGMFRTYVEPGVAIIASSVKPPLAEQLVADVEKLNASKPNYWGEVGESVTLNGLTITQEGPRIIVDGTATADTYVKLDGKLVASGNIAEIRALERTCFISSGCYEGFGVSHVSGSYYHYPPQTSGQVITPPYGYSTYSVTFYEDSNFNYIISPNNPQPRYLVTEKSHKYMIIACFYSGTTFTNCGFKITIDETLGSYPKLVTNDEYVRFVASRNYVYGLLVPTETSIGLNASTEDFVSNMGNRVYYPTAGVVFTPAKHGMRLTAGLNCNPFVQFGTDEYPTLFGLSPDKTYYLKATVKAKLGSLITGSKTTTLNIALYTYSQESGEYRLSGSITTLFTFDASNVGTEQTKDINWGFSIPYYDSTGRVTGIKIRIFQQGSSTNIGEGDYIELTDIQVTSSSTSSGWYPSYLDHANVAAWIRETDNKIAALEAMLANT